jgi:hypothetical protein
VRVDVLLGHAGRQVERALQAHGGRDLAIEELLERRDADLGQHRLEVRRGCRRVGAHSGKALGVGGRVEQAVLFAGVRQLDRASQPSP